MTRPSMPLNDQLFHSRPFVIIAGPCVIEGQEGRLNQEVAEALREIMARLAQIEPVEFYFKSSYDKANRSSGHSYRGPGLIRGLDILNRIKADVGVSLVTDVHESAEVMEVARVADMIQIPAFLCRQTNLLTAAGETGLPVNIKKGQFLSPPEVRHCAAKVQETGNTQIWITERGSSFGYNNLVVDMRSVAMVHELGLPLIFDATHSVQQPGGLGDRSGGCRDYAPTLARAAVAAGCDGLFFETHPDPDKALSDGPNTLPLDWVEPMLTTCLRLRQVLRQSQKVPA